MSRYTDNIYIGMHFVLTYIERLTFTVCLFFTCFCWSISCMSWVSKLCKAFLTCSETEATFLPEGF